MKHTPEELDRGQLDLMWNFLKFGAQKPNVAALKEHCELLRRLMLQKTGGQDRTGNKGDVDINDTGTIINCIVIESMCLYLSGELDKLESLSTHKE